MNFIKKHSQKLSLKRTQRTKNILLLENFLKEYIFEKYNINNFHLTFNNKLECGIRQNMIQNGCGSFYITFNVTNEELSIFEKFIYHNENQVFIFRLIFTILHTTQRNFGADKVNMFIKMNSSFFIFEKIANDFNFKIGKEVLEFLLNEEFDKIQEDLNIDIQNIYEKCFIILFKELDYDYERDMRLSFSGYEESINFIKTEILK